MKEKIKAAAARLSAWWAAHGAPFASGWWQGLDEHPWYHFASMMVGIGLLYLIKFLAWAVM